METILRSRSDLQRTRNEPHVAPKVTVKLQKHAYRPGQSVRIFSVTFAAQVGPWKTPNGLNGFQGILNGLEWPKMADKLHKHISDPAQCVCNCPVTFSAQVASLETFKRPKSSLGETRWAQSVRTLPEPNSTCQCNQ